MMDKPMTGPNLLLRGLDSSSYCPRTPDVVRTIEPSSLNTLLPDNLTMWGDLDEPDEPENWDDIYDPNDPAQPLPDEDYDPEEEAAKVYGMAYDRMGFPVEYRKEMSVTGKHSKEMREIALMFSRTFLERGETATVITDWAVYWDENQSRKRPISPDILVILGIEITPETHIALNPEDPERTYRTWEYGGKVLDFAMEISSRATFRNDISWGEKGKLRKYDKSGTLEYVTYDPTGRYLKPPLQMWKRKDGKLTKVEPDERGGFWSERLKLYMVLEDGLFTLYDPAGNKVERLREHEQRVWREQAEAREKLEVERARAEAERSRAEAERSRAEAERARADKERWEKEVERARADALAARVVELEYIMLERRSGN